MAHKMLGGGDTNVLKAGAVEDRGEAARLQAFIGAIAIGDVVKSTLGPMGQDKILQPIGGPKGMSGTVTNDGATILKKIWVDNPAAKILVDLSITQDEQCGDGTTSVVVLAAELLREAERLVQGKMHPQTLIRGFRIALAAAKKRLSSIARDSGGDYDKLKTDLNRIAMTTLSSKLLNEEKEYFADLAVNAVLRLKGKPNLDYVQVLKIPGGSIAESRLEPGFILHKRLGPGQPKKRTNCNVLVSNTSMDADKVKIYGARVNVNSLAAVSEIESAEKAKMKAKVEKVTKHGCNVFVNRQLVYSYPEELLRGAGVMTIEHADFDGTERLAAVLGGDIVSTFDTPEKATLGFCETIEEVLIGEEHVIRFSGCRQNEACTIVLRGASQHVLDEAERSLHDALAVIYQTVFDTRVVNGGGAAEAEMSLAIEEAVKDCKSGKEGIAAQAFGRALLQIPRILAENAGLDATELQGQLVAAHKVGKATHGIDCESGAVADMEKLGVVESMRSKMSSLCAAAEAAEQVCRVDEIIRCAPRQRDQ